MHKVDWIVGQAFFWVLVVAVVLAGLVGVRRAGAVLAAQQAALVGGRSPAGTAWGLAQAGSDLSAWWGLSAGQVGQAVVIEEYPARQSLRVRVQGAMPTLFGGSAELSAGSFQRLERFTVGPP
jgi:hypothetical protein